MSNDTYWIIGVFCDGDIPNKDRFLVDFTLEEIQHLYDNQLNYTGLAL